MLQVAFIQENKEDIIARLAKRNIDATEMINEAIAFDEDRKAIQTKLDNTKAESNTLSKDIGNLYKSGETQKANILKQKTTQLKDITKTLEQELNDKVDALAELLYRIPNVPNPIVPAGNTDEDNEETFREGDIPKLHEGALPHWELAKKYKINDGLLRSITHRL